MINKIVLWMVVLALNVSLAFAQTGLFDATTGGRFIVMGILFIVVFLVIKAFLKSFKKQK